MKFALADVVASVVRVAQGHGHDGQDVEEKGGEEESPKPVLIGAGPVSEEKFCLVILKHDLRQWFSNLGAPWGLASLNWGSRYSAKVGGCPRGAFTYLGITEGVRLLGSLGCVASTEPTTTSLMGVRGRGVITVSYS